jgi:small subunit ribosomal protein S20
MYLPKLILSRASHCLRRNASRVKIRAVHVKAQEESHVPNIRSSIKRVRSDEAKTRVNKSRKSEIRTLVKKAIVAKEQGLPEAERLERDAQAALDRASAHGIISKNTAARRKSRIARVKQLEA